GAGGVLGRLDRRTQHDQLLILPDWSDQASGRVGRIGADHVPRSSAPLGSGEGNAGQGERGYLRADLDIAQDELCAPGQDVSVVPSGAGLAEHTVVGRGGAITRGPAS